MESPFFRSHWSNYQPRPRYSTSFREVPVHRPEARPSPKVVSIPVHFVGSDPSRSDAALRIQKVFRGFLVRKSVKRIAAVKCEVDEVEKRMRLRETVEAIRRDATERLRVSETLMSLLFRLDSVRGVDSGVRDCRKAVIKKAIALQERIDAIVAGDVSSEVQNVESADDQATETEDSNESSESSDDDDQAESEPKGPEIDQNPELCANYSNSSEIESVQALEKEDKATLFTDEPMPNSSDSQEDADENEALKSQALAQTDGAAVEDVEEKAEPEPEPGMAGVVHTAMEATENEEKAPEESAEKGSSDTESKPRSTNPQDTAEEEEGMEIAQPDKSEQAKKAEEEGGNGRRSKELIERMLEDNEKMMGLMAELYDRNAIQTRLLSSLSQRVEQLERAYICEKLRRKKKQRRDCCGRTKRIVGNCESCSA